MKKYLALLLALVMVLSLCACGNSAPAATEAPAAEPAAEPAADDLVSLAQAEGELVVYGSCEEEYLAAACQHFEDLFGIKTTYQRLSTGEVQAKIEEENGNPSADVWFGGTTDPYNMCAAEGLLEPYEAVNASHLISDMYKDADNNWFGIYKGILGFMVNTDELERMGLDRLGEALGAFADIRAAAGRLAAATRPTSSACISGSMPSISAAVSRYVTSTSAVAVRKLCRGSPDMTALKFSKAAPLISPLSEGCSMVDSASSSAGRGGEDGLRIRNTAVSAAIIRTTAIISVSFRLAMSVHPKMFHKS